MLNIFTPDRKVFYNAVLSVVNRTLVVKREGRINTKTTTYLTKQLSLYKIPGHISNVIVYLYQTEDEMHDNLLYRGEDASGKIQYIYGRNYTLSRIEDKNTTLSNVLNKLPRINRFVTKHLSSGDTTAYNTVSALMIAVALEFALRVGKRVYELQNGTTGLSTIRRKHIQLKPDRIIISFTGKSNIKHIYIIPAHAVLYTPIKNLYNNAESIDDYLFRYTSQSGTHRVNESRINETLRLITDGQVTIKDIRMYVSNRIFAQYKLKGVTDTDALEETAKEIGHTKAIAKKSYIIDRLFGLDNNFIMKHKTTHQLLKAVLSMH